MAEEAKKVAEKPAQETYQVKNIVRRVSSRLHRAKSATRHRFKLFVGGHRVLRNKKLQLSAEEFELHKEQIRQMVLNGEIALFLPNGIRVTSLPDGRLVHTKPDGSMKIDAEPQPKQAPPIDRKEPEKTSTPPAKPTYDPAEEPPRTKYELKDSEAEESPEIEVVEEKAKSTKKSSRKKG